MIAICLPVAFLVASANLRAASAVGLNIDHPKWLKSSGLFDGDRPENV
jgi:hypothetical protein